VPAQPLAAKANSSIEKETSGFIAEYAENAEKAILLYHDLSSKGERVWLIISDQALPGQHGDEFLAHIHKIDRQVMTVLCSERKDSESTGETINHAGLKYYLERPFSQENLLAVLENLKIQYEMTTLLNEINLHFASSIDLSEILHTVFHNILNVIQAEAGSIFLFDDYQTDALVCRICQGPKDITGLRIPIEKGIVGHVARTGEIDVTENVKTRDIHDRDIDKKTGFMTRSMVSVPLAYKDHILGVIQVINKKDDQQFSQTDITLLQSLSSGAALAIQNAQYARSLVQQERIRSELLIAHQIQQGILPESFPGHPGIHFEAANLPAKHVGGDFYDYFEIGNGRFAFFIGDVCGKGIPAAIFMASSRSTIRSQVLANPHPASVLPLANRLIGLDAKNKLFVTVFYGVYDVDTHILRYTNAGHVPAFLFRPSTGRCASLYNANLPLGIFLEGTFLDAEFQLEKDDVVVLYTDGITEALNANEVLFGAERLVEIILKYGTRSPQELLEIILERVKEFSEGQEQRDDITVMIVKV
jgi:sigma-B regulation protein RsbU (phosphoserine phosphatase)